MPDIDSEGESTVSGTAERAAARGRESVEDWDKRAGEPSEDWDKRAEADGAVDGLSSAVTSVSESSGESCSPSLFRSCRQKTVCLS